MSNLIPLFKPSCSDLEIKYITKVLKSGWWGLGPRVEEFEKRFATLVGAKYCVGLNSATSALQLALKVNNIENGEVILPALTFVSTGLAALYNNNKVIFADIDEETLCMDWNDAINKINRRTKAIIPVHYGGRVLPSPYKFYGVVIEDAAHAAGNTMAGKDMACWSFHAVKNIAMGDGGAITTNDKELYQKLLPMRWCGIDRSTWERAQKKYGWDYSIETMGYKMHMNDLQAALGLAQLDRLEENNGKRKRLVKMYLDKLKNKSWIRLPTWDENSSWHLFVIRVDASIRNKFIDYLLENDISAGVHYKPLNTYSIFPQTPLPVTDRVWKTLVTLPLFPDMTDEEFEYIIKTIKEYV